MITWLIGKNEEIDIFWSYSKNKVLKNLNNLNSNNLFENENYKYIFEKNNESFFQQNPNYESELIIKGCLKKQSFMENIIDFDNLSITELFKIFINFYNLNFEPKELEFINVNCKNLKDLINLNFLKQINLNFNYFNYFKNNINSENWFNLLKENKLINLCILNESLTIPILTFCNKYHKKNFITQIILANIKSGDQLWEKNKLWEKLI